MNARYAVRFCAAWTLGLCAALGTAHAGEPADWPCWRGRNGDGKSSLKGIRKDWSGGLKKLWEIRDLCQGTGSDAWGAPSVKDGKVVVFGRKDDEDILYCFDADKGGPPLWKTAYAAPGTHPSGYGAGARSTPCLDGERVYAFGSFGHLTCLNLADGKIVWQKDVRKEFATGIPWAGYASSPLVAGNLVIVQVCNRAMQVSAFKKDSGEKAWTSTPANNENYGSPIKATLQGVEQIVAFGTDGVRGLDVQSGKDLWKFACASSDLLGSSPAVDHDIVFTLSGRNAGCRAVRVNEAPVKLWNSALSSNHSDPIISDGYAYVFAGASGDQGDLRCLDVKTGAEKWVTKDLGRMGTLVLVDGALLCLTYAGDLFLVKAQSDGFTKIAECKGILPCEKEGVWTVPVVAHGKLYLRYKGTLACYDLMH